MGALRRASGLALLLCLAVPAPGHALRPQAGYPVLPSHYGIVCDTLTFRTRDGVSLKGWFFPAQDSAGVADSLIGRVVPVPPERRPPARPYGVLDARPRPTIVLCDGDAGNMSDLLFYAYPFFIHGFNVFTFDWRGFGESDPFPTDPDRLVYAEYLRDYDAAIDFVKTRREVDGKRIGLLGFSTGAYLSFAMAARRSDVAALAGRALITSFDDLLPILARLDPGRHWYAPTDYPRDLLPGNAAGRVRIPVLLVVGDNDSRTPPWMSRRVFRSLAGPKELWIVGGAGHGGRRAPEMVGYPDFFVRVRSFFARHMNAGGPTVGTPAK